MKQLTLLTKPSLEFGGSLNINPRKHCRTLDSKTLTHLVLKIKNTKSLLLHRKALIKIIYRQAHLAGVKVHEMSVQRNHVHHAISYPNRAAYNKFIRCATSQIARKLGRGVFSYRPYTRVLTSNGRPKQNLLLYIERNELEAWGVVPYDRKRRTRDLLK